MEVVTDVPAPSTGARQFAYPVHHRPQAGGLLAIVRRCDILLHQNISLKVVWPLALAKTKFVACHQSWYGTRGQAGNRREAIKQWLARRCAANISCSHAVRDALGCGGEVIGNPYGHERFRVLALPREKDLVFAGRLVSDKGVDVLLRALGRLGEVGNRPTLTIAGDGPERAALECQVDTMGLRGQVEFVGSRGHDELPAILNRHRVMVVPSLWDEPFGIVALEGAACGCVVVGSAGGGLPEAIGPCGVTFPNGDVERLATVLAELLSDEGRLATFRRAAPEHLAKHRADVVAAKYLEFFHKVLKRTGATAS